MKTFITLILIVNTTLFAQTFATNASCKEKLPGRTNVTAFSPSGNLFATASKMGTGYSRITIWQNKKAIQNMETFGKVTAVVFSDENTLVTADNSPHVCVWNLKDGKRIHKMKAKKYTGELHCLSVHGNRAVTGNAYYSINIWDLKNGKELQSIDLEDAVRGVAYSKDGAKIAIAGGKDKVATLDVASGKITRLAAADVKVGRAVAFSPDGKLMAAGYLTKSGNHTVTIWDTTTWKPVCSTLNHKAYINSVAFGPQSKRLASGANEDGLIITDTKTGKALQTLHVGERYYVQSLDFSTQGNVVAASSDFHAYVWEPAK
ncbi:WD40 repeat domain-containing protein [Candidatus Uabimicrobium amorphum]|uniref:Anaphase-promoting complex subunit 4 WD40 domain-containing protein n=1 Tax=Uabimicrobium amorphum TaxID=2596890 RepID=A0A5S9IMG4_UABAM|nr:hypothetical protein [Candidatus Uabimicrobium amorphum]BBM84227.1 hypothetical protein UABAM_02583 [Candidatus Uabimicrobium amorphum]